MDIFDQLLEELNKIKTASELIKQAETISTNAAYTIEQLELQNKKFIEIIEEQKRLLNMTAINDQDGFISKVEFDLIETSLNDLKENFAHSINECAAKVNLIETELSNNLKFVNHFAKIVDELKVKTDKLKGMDLIVNNLKDEIEIIKDKILSVISHSNNVAGSIGNNFAHFEIKMNDLNNKVNDFLKENKSHKLNVKISEIDNQLNSTKKVINTLTEENEQMRLKLDRTNMHIITLRNDFKSESITELIAKYPVFAEFEKRLNKMKLHLQISLTISAIVIGYIIFRELFKLI